MPKCFRCKTTRLIDRHHIDGQGTAVPKEERNDKASNLIHLCRYCHDFVEEICEMCDLRLCCNNLKFQKCWHYDEEKPVYFREKIEVNER